MTNFSNNQQLIAPTIENWLKAEKKGNEYPVNFNDAWQWLEFSRKDGGLKSFLNSGFTETLDFTVIQRNEKDVTKFGGYKKVTYYHLTTDCFKTWSMMVNTAKGKEIRKYFLECEKQLKELKAERKKAITHYTDRIIAIKTNLKKSSPSWCVLEKCGHLLLDVERAGYPIDVFDMLDISVGGYWGKYRKGKEWTCEVKKAIYDIGDRRLVREIHAYDYCELGYFSQWLEDVYTQIYLPKYLLNKYGALVKA